MLHHHPSKHNPPSVSASPVANYLTTFIRMGLVDVLTLNIAGAHLCITTSPCVHSPPYHPDDAPDELGVGVEYNRDQEGLKSLIYVYNRCIQHHRHRHNWSAW